MIDSLSKTNPHASLNAALLDPSRWGWTATGGVADVQSPHLRARRKAQQVAFRQREPEGIPGVGAGNGRSDGVPNAKRQRMSSQAGEGADDVQNTEASLLQTDGGDAKQTSASDTTKKDTAKAEAATKAINATKTQTETETTTGSNIAGDGGDAAIETPATKADGEMTEDIKMMDTSGPEQRPKQQIPATNTGDEEKGESKIDDVVLDSCFVRIAKEPVEKSSKGKDEDKDKSDDAQNEDGANPNDPEAIHVCVTSMCEKKGLDAFAYHRGREGSEPRDRVSGALLCDLEPSDTNHVEEEPKLKANIVVAFPLHDENSDDSPQDEAYFRETVVWDLSSPSTQSPMLFAQDVATEYGLTFGQTMDLATSIEQQLESHILQHAAYTLPYPIRDPHGNVRRVAAAPSFKRLYDNLFNPESGGKQLSRKEMQERQHALRGGSRQSMSSTNNSNSCHRMSSSRMNTISHGTIDPKYISEVQRKAQTVSYHEIANLQQCDDDGVALVALENHSCHGCQKQVPKAYAFGCGVDSHAFCDDHLEIAHGISRGEDGVWKAPYCPVCSLTCPCGKCERRLDSLANELRRVCNEDCLDVADVTMDELVARLKKKRGSSAAATAAAAASTPDPDKSTKPKRSTASRGRFRDWVPKLPSYDFPREVSGMREVEVGTVSDYSTVFAATGPFVCDNPDEVAQSMAHLTSSNRAASSAAQSAATAEANEALEDGNVDYCHFCEKHGNLLCCDFCPRAFHPGCIKPSVQANDLPWECVVCQKENTILKDDKVTGHKEFPTLLKEFKEHQVDLPTVDEMRLYSMIRELLSRLIDYDFGYMFRDPVNVKAIPEYANIVKTPIDLGTIHKRIGSGYYFNVARGTNRDARIGDGTSNMDIDVANSINNNDSAESSTIGAGSIDAGAGAETETGKVRHKNDILIDIFKDIELVWHNCFTFNLEGSAIFRMAAVHRKRMLKMVICSIADVLSDEVKAAVASFVRGCEMERNNCSDAQEQEQEQSCDTSSPETPPSSPSTRATEVKPPPSTVSISGVKPRPIGSLRRPKSKHKITIKLTKTSLARPVAVLDPDTCRIIKAYSTQKSALQAALFLMGLGHRCEFETLSESAMKNLIHRGAKDPRSRLFGHRWVSLQGLQQGAVVIPIVELDLVEVKIGSGIYIFPSVDEASTYFAGRSRKLRSEMREAMIKVKEPSEQWTKIAGFEVRRPLRALWMPMKPNSGQERQKKSLNQQEQRRQMEQNESSSHDMETSDDCDNRSKGRTKGKKQAPEEDSMTINEKDSEKESATPEKRAEDQKRCKDESKTDGEDIDNDDGNGSVKHKDEEGSEEKDLGQNEDGVEMSAIQNNGVHRLARVPKEAYDAQLSYVEQESQIIRIDVLLQKLLVGFSSFESAFGDWGSCCKASFTVSLSNEQATRGLFVSEYLDGGKPVDGMVWVKAKKWRKENRFGEEAEHPTQEKPAQKSVPSQEKDEKAEVRASTAIDDVTKADNEKGKSKKLEGHEDESSRSRLDKRQDEPSFPNESDSPPAGAETGAVDKSTPAVAPGVAPTSTSDSDPSAKTNEAELREDTGDDIGDGDGDDNSGGNKGVDSEKTEQSKEMETDRTIHTSTAKAGVDGADHSPNNSSGGYRDNNDDSMSIANMSEDSDRSEDI